MPTQIPRDGSARTLERCLSPPSMLPTAAAYAENARHRAGAARLRPTDLLGARAWTALRAQRIDAARQHRRGRTVELDARVRLQFEDHETIRWQMQEVVRIERLECPLGIAQEFEHYAHLLPDGETTLCSTLFIEIPDAVQRNAELPALAEAAHHCYLRLAGVAGVIFAHANPDLPDAHLGRPSAVHFLRFDLSPRQRDALLAGAPMSVGCDHPACRVERLLTPAMQAALRRDFGG